MNTCLSKLLGKSQYTNCKGTETELNIACANKDTAAAVNNSTLTKRLLCSYSEHPVQYEDAAAAAAGCGFHGSFDPWTYITLDHASGVCRLKFLALTDSCDAATAPVVTDGGFGVMVEAPLSTGTGPDSHHHEQNEDTNHKDNSGLLLRFSTDAGLTYYNNQTPRNTVLLDTSSSRRTLVVDYQSKNIHKCPCLPATDSFSGISLYSMWRQEVAFETCYRLGTTPTYCWSKSYRYFNTDDGWSYGKCVPNGTAWDHVDQSDMKWVNPVTHPYSCGDACKTMHQI